MRTKFTTTDQVDAYLSTDLIECLECGKQFSFLANHLRRTHGIDADEYRESWGLPAMTPLAGQTYRDIHRAKIRRMQTDGTIKYDHLPIATAKAKGTSKEKVGVAKIAFATLIAKLRPGDAHLLPPGSKRADGRDADLARKSQILRRAQKNLRKSEG
mgnify:CR=1 FL=1|jgi:hypothetical protein